MGSPAGARDSSEAFGLPHPVAQRLYRKADLARKRAHRRPRCPIQPLPLQDQAKRTLAHFSRKRRNSLRRHDPSLPRFLISGKPRLVDTDDGVVELQAHSLAIQDREGARPLVQSSRVRWHFVFLVDGGYLDL